jgi:hypothetical protein
MGPQNNYRPEKKRKEKKEKKRKKKKKIEGHTRNNRNLQNQLYSRLVRFPKAVSRFSGRLTI